MSSHCSLDNDITFGLGFGYSIATTFGLILVSIWSYSSVKRLAKQQGRDFKCSKFVSDFWKKRKCFLPVISNFFDQGSDIGVMAGFCLIWIWESASNDNDCVGINGMWLFIFSLIFFLSYRIMSSIVIYIYTKNIWYSLSQFLFEGMMYRAIWVNYTLMCKEPCSPQKWLQNMEAMMESFPQLCMQLFFLLKTSDKLQGLVVISIIFSFIQLTNKAVTEDKPLFDTKWQSIYESKDDKWYKISFRYLLRVLFRIIDIGSRISIIVVTWSQVGGLVIIVTLGIEITVYIYLAIKKKDAMPLTWIAILPLNNLINGEYCCCFSLRSIITIIRLFIQHILFLVLIFYNNSNNTQNIVSIAITCLYITSVFFYLYLHYNGKRILSPSWTTVVSTNRAVTEMVKLDVANEINQMLQFGVKYNKNDIQNAFIWSLKNNKYKCIECLMDATGVNINEKNMNEFGDTPLIFAAKNHDAQMVEILIKSKNVNINETNINGETAIMMAARFGSDKCLQLLLDITNEHNININDTNNEGFTGLIFAARNNHDKCVQLLLNCEDINIHQKNVDGDNALDAANKENAHKCVELLSPKFNPN